MLQHEKKYCSKCGAPFECKVTNIAQCQCSEVQLSEATIAFLQKTEYDCLCKECLHKIDDFVRWAQVYHFPHGKKEFIEGLHYYQENKNWVFTELYHYLRGSCCGNGCRHCVYGFHLQ